MDTKNAALLGLGMMAAAVPLMGYALSLPFRIRYEKVSFPDLPGHLKGLKILHISDLHCRYHDKISPDHWPEILKLDFDMTVFTGDIVLDNAAQLYPHLEGMKALVKKAPAFYVDGNHEDTCYDEVARFLAGIGVIGLYNNCGKFAVGAKNKQRSLAVSLAGFRDYYYLKKRRFIDVAPLMKKIADNRNFHIILTHQPQIFDHICEAVTKEKSFSALVLAGHTHGGQIRLPFMPTLLAPGQGILPRYGDGWYQNGSNDKLKLFISRGVGATRFKFRLFNPPEVAVIELL